MNRREFLKCGASVVAGSSLPAAIALPGGWEANVVQQEQREGAARGGRGPRRMKKSLKYGMIGEGETLREKLAAAGACGFEGVELDSPNDWSHDEVRSAAAEAGVELPGVIDGAHWRDTLSDPDAAVRKRGRDALETALRDCKAYGGTTVLLVPAVVKKEVSYADAYRRSQEEIRRVLPLAEELGVTIAIENVWNHFLLSPLEAARYVDEFESERIAWYFDPGNVVNYGWPEHWIAALGKRIVKLDVKEFSRKKRDDEGLWKGFAVELMEGDCDWPAIMRSLDAIGYEGWMSAEVGGGDAERLRFISERMDRIIAS